MAAMIARPHAASATRSKSKPGKPSAQPITPARAAASSRSTACRGSRPFRRVLDLGCGSGVLGIAAAKRHRGASVIATDIDP
ncbi:MAG: methyltransferase, partial [Sphingomonadales bacterium]|nr:methyltransferase [Sphingomonadales bacterium]